MEQTGGAQIAQGENNEEMKTKAPPVLVTLAGRN
jgi:hypothetical protein